MQIETINRIIIKAVENEKQTDSFAKLAIQAARNNGRNINMTEAKGISQFVITYIKQVPLYIEEGLKSSVNFGIQNEMNGMMNELMQYWKLEQDLIPDNLGLIGITDDAYASMFLLQSLSDYCQGTAGHGLLKTDLKNANLLIRNLLGEAIALNLEQRVGVTISNNMMGHVFNQFYQNIFFSGFAFGNAAQANMNQREIEQQVNVQLGAMGIF